MSTPSRRACATACTALLSLAACAGAAPEAPAVAAPRTAVITPAGGTLEAGGLELTFPAGAVKGDLAVTITPVEKAAGAVASFRLEPAGRTLLAPATLRFRAPSLPAGAAFAWDAAGARSLFPATAAGGVLTAAIHSLGYDAQGQLASGAAAAAPARPGARAAGTGGAGGVDVATIDCAADLPALRARLLGADWVNDLPRAIQLRDQYQAVELACTIQDVASLQARACEAYAGAVSTAAVLAADGWQAFADLARPILSGVAMVMKTGAGCSTAEGVDILNAKFGQLVTFLSAGLDRSTFADALGRRRMRDFLAYDAHCRLLGLELCGVFATSIYPQALATARAEAYQDCLEAGDALMTSQLYLLGMETDGLEASVFLGFAGFTYADLERDIHYCTPTLMSLRVFADAATVPIELTAEARQVRGAGPQGAAQTSVPVAVPEGGSLTVGGDVFVPICPGGASYATDDLVFRIGAAEIARRPASGARFTTTTSPVIVDPAVALPVAGLSASTPAFPVEVWREGPGCGAYSGALHLYTLGVSQVAVPPPGTYTWSGSYAGDLSGPVSATLTIGGGQISGTAEAHGVTWSVSGSIDGSQVAIGFATGAQAAIEFQGTVDVALSGMGGTWTVTAGPSAGKGGTWAMVRTGGPL